MNGKNTILEIKDLQKSFPVASGQFLKKRDKITALDHVSLSVSEGETLGIVGESGCGKTTLAKVILRLVKADGGAVLFDGQDILGADKRLLRQLREQIQVVFQDPYASLNPRMTVEKIITEPLRIARRPYTKGDILKLVEQVGLTAEDMERFPAEFSGGQRQRICIARAIVLNPRVLICDEPVSALDVSVQSQILNLFNRLQQERGLTYLFISHDLAVVRHVSDRVGVMYLGSVVETGPTELVYHNPLHPYTKCLLDSILEPIPNPERLANIPIRTDLTAYSGIGCPFAPRCMETTKQCYVQKPVEMELEPGHIVCCHKYSKGCGQ